MSCCFYQGDCLLNFQRLADNSVDFIYFDPPFGITMNGWDEKLPWEKLFAEMFRVLKENGILAIHCSVPFNYTLIRAAPKPPKYSWYWKKEQTTTPFLGGVQPLRNTEEILVWYKKKARYYGQRIGNEERTYYKGGGMSGHYHNTTVLSMEERKTTAKGFHYTHHIEFKRSVDGFSTRPVEMIELMLKSYTKPGDVVVDPTCHHGVSGVVAKKLGLKWIGFDKYFLPSKLMV